MATIRPNRGQFTLPSEQVAGAAAAPSSAAQAGGGGSGETILNRATWLWQPSNSQTLDVGPNSETGAIALPAIGDTATILTYTVPASRAGRVIAIGIDYQEATSGVPFQQGVVPPELTFSIQINGRPVQGFEQFNYLPGAVSAPTPLAGAGIMLQENQTITILVTNNTLAAGLTPSYVAARIQGYIFDKNLYPKKSGYQT
jgi:hypothetical protein